MKIKDPIYREDAIKAINLKATIPHDIASAHYANMAINAIRSVPSADRPQGEWIDWLGKGNEWECSVCRCSIESHGSIAYKFCPMCGARMKGADDE